jgi:hypothetical protein
LYSVDDFSWSERKTNPEDPKALEPKPRHSHVIAADNDRNQIYMLGGVSENDVSLCKDAVWMFSVDKNEWNIDKELNLFARRIGHSALVHCNSLIIVGGYGADSKSPLDFFAAVIDIPSKDVKILIQVKNKTDSF